MYSFTRTWLLHLAWVSLLLGGCQSKVYLMPAPVSLGSDAEFFELSEENRDENLLYTLYASNRLPYSKGKNTRGYTVFPTDALEMGLTVHRVGEPGMSWEDLYRESISDNRDEDLIIYEVHARKKVRYEAEEDLTQLTPTAEGFFQKINQQIEKYNLLIPKMRFEMLKLSADKEIEKITRKGK